MQADGGYEDHPVRPLRHRLLRPVRVRKIQQRHNDRLRPDGRGAEGVLRPPAQGRGIIRAFAVKTIKASGQGAFMVLATPPFGLFFPSVLSIAGMFLIFENYRHRNFFAILVLMFLFFYGYFFFGGSWLTAPMGVSGIDNSFNRYAPIFKWFLPFIVASGACLFFPFVAKIKQNWLRFFGFAVAFCLGEWLRSQTFWGTGFPFIQLGSIWIHVKPILQFLSLFGIYGLSFVTVILISSLAVVFAKYFRRRFSYIVLSSLLFVSIFIWGSARIKDNAYNPNLNLRLVQSMKNRRLDSDELAYQEENVDRVINLANYEIPGNINLVVMSESVFPYNLANTSLSPSYSKGNSERIGKAIPKNGFLIAGFIGDYLIGNILDAEGIQQKRYNMVGVFNDKAEMISNYKKVHLAPLGEYVPNYLARLFPRKLTSGGSELDPGLHRNIVYNDAYIVPPFVANLCYEESFTGEITDKKDMTEGAIDWMLNLTDDIWFRDSYYPYQHFDTAVLRAVEEGLPYVRVANDGSSAVIDMYGRFVEGQATFVEFDGISKIKSARKEERNILNYNEIGTLDVRLPLPSGVRTLYSKTGDSFVLKFFLAMFFALFVLDFILQKTYLKIFRFFKNVKNGFVYAIKYLRR